MSAKPVSMLVIYRVKRAREGDFIPLLKKHWPALDRFGLAGPERSRLYRGEGKDGKLSFVEFFQWKDAEASGVAHHTPEVMQIWEPMGPMLEGLELIQLDPLSA